MKKWIFEFNNSMQGQFEFNKSMKGMYWFKFDPTCAESVEDGHVVVLSHDLSLDQLQDGQGIPE